MRVEPPVPYLVTQPQLGTGYYSTDFPPKKVSPALLVSLDGHYTYSKIKVRTNGQKWNPRGDLS